MTLPMTIITPKYYELAKRSKIIQFVQFFDWLARLCIFYLIQCQVLSKVRLTLQTQ